MNKKNKIDKDKIKTVRSINNNIRSSVRKLNPILKGIVGKKVDVAIRDLQFSEKRITRDIRKTLSSAIANAENNFQYDIDKLIVREALWTDPFFTFPFGIASLTEITMVSPILAYRLFDPPKTLIHSIFFAPVLSATFNSV